MGLCSKIKQSDVPKPSDLIPMEPLSELGFGLKHNGNLPNPQTARELLPMARGVLTRGDLPQNKRKVKDFGQQGFGAQQVRNGEQ
jgi:hypothetical protein